MWEPEPGCFLGLLVCWVQNIRGFIGLPGIACTWLLLAGAAMAQPAVPLTQPPVTASAPAMPAAPQVLSSGDVALYRQIMAAERSGQTAKAKALLAQVSDTSLTGYAEAQYFLSVSPKKLSAKPLVEWLEQYRDLAVADRIYRLAVSYSTKKVRRHHKTITVAVVTHIPAPS